MLEMHRLAKSIDINESLKPKVHDDRNFPITNLERFYNDKNVASFLGIEFDRFGTVKGKIDKNEFEKGFKKIVEDVASSVIDSRKYNSATERRKYLDKLHEQYKPDLSKLGSFGASDFEPPLPQEPKNREHKASSRTPKGLFFQKDLPFNLPSTSLKLIYNELKEIDVAKFPNATHDLLRSFLECTLVFYLKETKKYESIQKNNLHNPSLSEMLGFLASSRSTINDANIIQVINQIKTNWGNSYSLERMNMINHNENWNSTERDVRSAWGRVESLVKILLNPKDANGT